MVKIFRNTAIYLLIALPFERSEATPVRLGPQTLDEVCGVGELCARLCQRSLSLVGLGQKPPILKGIDLPNFQRWNYISKNDIQSEALNEYGRVTMTAGGTMFRIVIQPTIHTPPGYRFREMNYRRYFSELGDLDWVEVKFMLGNLADKMGFCGSVEIIFDTAKAQSYITENTITELVRDTAWRLANPSLDNASSAVPAAKSRESGNPYQPPQMQ